MPTIQEARALPTDHHWHPSSLEGQQLAREQRERELALFKKYEEFYKRHHAEAAAANVELETQTETPGASGEIGAA